MTTPIYSLIIPAYNEAEELPATLAAAQQAMAQLDEPGELIVVDNNSTDATAEVARAHGAAVVFEPINQISRARNAGGRAATGRYLVFVDADTRITADLLRQAIDALHSGEYVGGGARIAFDQPVVWPARFALWLWTRYSLLLKEAAGCFLFCTREAFDAVEGFSTRIYASEELWFSKAIKRWAKPRGQRFVILGEANSGGVITSARKAQRPWRTAATMIMLMLFPPAVFFRSLCGFWYKRIDEAPAR